jgi:energy-coupling factor transporter ATP-binding protein EcfA2
MMDFNEIRNPFPGLRPFELDESNLFFGREGQSDELLARLQRTRFLAVVGTSGSGKSSLIRAGLLPALFGGLMGGAGSSWRIAVLRPGNDPIGNLAGALSDPEVLGVPDQDSELQNTIIETTLRRSTLGLVDATQLARIPSDENLLIVVDQFEELFRFKEARREDAAEDDAAAFVKLLIEASDQEAVRIYVVLTMRSDFLGECSQFVGLPEAINQGQYLIPRMSRDERQSAITGPVAVGGGEITLPLVSRLLNDAGDNPDQLPIMQHALMRTWDYCMANRQNGEALDLEHYEEIGTMSDALSRHADEAFAELPDERSRVIAEKLFKQLTERGADNREIRRPSRLAEICSVAEASEDEVVAVIDIFRQEGRSFLMPPIGVVLDSETVIDVSHESLIRNWVRLKAWVSEEADSARMYRRLAAATAFSGEGYLPSGLLEAALVWRKKNDPNAAWAARYSTESEITFEQVMAFIDASKAAQAAAAAERERQRNAELERERREREQAQLLAEQQRCLAEHERHAARRLRRYVVTLIIIAGFAVGLAGTAVFLFTRARQSESRAKTSAAEATRFAVVARIAKDDADHQTALAMAAEKVATQKREEADKSARALQVALRVANQARVEANHQRDLARTSAKVANDEKAKAEVLAKNLQTALDDANAAKANAVEQTKIATNAAEAAKQSGMRNALITRADMSLRKGIAAAQRGHYGEAYKELQRAIDDYQTPLVNDQEAVADTISQMGNSQFDALYSDYLEYGRIFPYDIKLLKDGFENAANIYGGTKVNAPEKAAASRQALGRMLLQFTNQEAQKSGAEKSNIKTNKTDEAALDFSLREGFNFPDDPVIPGPKGQRAELRTDAIQLYERAFDDYEKAFNQTKPTSGDEALHTIQLGMFQIANFYLKEANLADYPYATKESNEYRRKAIARYEGLLQTYEGDDDLDKGKLLIRIGGLYYELGDQAKANSYYDRVMKVFKERKDETGEKDLGDALLIIGVTLHDAELRKAGTERFEQSVRAFNQTTDAAINRKAPSAELYECANKLVDRVGDVLIKAHEYREASCVYQKAAMLYRRIIEDPSYTEPKDPVKKRLDKVERDLHPGDGSTSELSVQDCTKSPPN